MNRALFTRKAVDINELKNRTGPEKDKKYFVVEKVIELDDKEFDEFSNDLLEDRDFIRENIDLMYVGTNDIWHCILIKPKGRDEAILTEAEGYSYSRYSAYIPDCKKVVY